MDEHIAMTDTVLMTEPTEQGEQCLAPGIRPITQKDRLQLLCDAPLRPRRPQKSLCVGLFDEGYSKPARHVHPTANP